jgi:hypothetical protein
MKDKCSTGAKNGQPPAQPKAAKPSMGGNPKHHGVGHGKNHASVHTNHTRSNANSRKGS